MSGLDPLLKMFPPRTFRQVAEETGLDPLSPIDNARAALRMIGHRYGAGRQPQVRPRPRLLEGVLPPTLAELRRAHRRRERPGLRRVRPFDWRRDA